MNSQLTKFDVFISHSAATKDVAKHFYYNLQANGQHAWFDVAQLEAGLPLKAELQKGVSNSKTYLLLHSQEATESDLYFPRSTVCTKYQISHWQWLLRACFSGSHENSAKNYSNWASRTVRLDCCGDHRNSCSNPSNQ